MKWTHKSWLISCPCGDGNFKVHLKEASDTDIKEVLAELPEKGNKSKIAVLKTELRKRNKASRDKEIALIYMQEKYKKLQQAPLAEVAEHLREIFKKIELRYIKIFYKKCCA